MFEGFTLENVDVGGAVLRVRHGGGGPPVLLLHGHPRTHATWSQVAPLLADDFTVVCPDLRGYGKSSKPPSTEDHEPYSKRAMAKDCAALMRALGHRRFAVVGHDRGAYVAHRLAVDAAPVVSRLAVLDAIPLGEALARCDARFAERWYHWFFYGQTVHRAEDYINLDPERWYSGSAELMGSEAFADYLEAIHDPATVHAMMEDYRAGLGVDRANDDADRAAGRKVTCPTLVLWAARDDMGDLYGDPVDVWRAWAVDVSGQSIGSGHHIAEEAPAELARTLRDFLVSKRH